LEAEIDASEAITQPAREQVKDATRHDTFLRLMAQYEPALRRLAAGYVWHGADREDLFQEIAVGLWQAIPKFRGDASERTWLYRIAHNIAISSSTRLHHRARREKTMPDAFDRASGGPDSEQELLRNEKRELLLEAIRGLRAVDRQVVLLHLEGLDYSEIEEVSGLSQSAIATRLSRLRYKLRKLMQSRETREL
jgi:RNA polymerase sigma-70 factor (ECF subfamily)